MARKKLITRIAAMALAAVTAFSGFGFWNHSLKAETTNFIVNGNFEDSKNGWTETGAISGSLDVNKNNNSTTSYNYWTEGDSTLELSQTVSLSAGNYKLTVTGNGNVGDLMISTESGAFADTRMENVNWDTWSDFSVEFTLTEAKEVDIHIGGALEDNGIPAGSWGGIDNVTLVAVADYTLSDLQEVVASVPEDYETLGFTSASVATVQEAVAAANACTQETDVDTLKAAAKDLQTALGNLRFDADIFVEKIENYDADTAIRGADVSTYISLMDSFAELNQNITDESKKLGFRDWEGNLLDEQGFFNLLADSGINYIRTRVWNDPYDENGMGYGGGNNDLEKAIRIGQWATNAGMSNLIDFHLSDFWADPSKQMVPKAWEGYTVDQKAEAIYAYITDSLTQLNDAGVDVGMVQVGNETTKAICGESDAEAMNQLFDAGCDAIKAFNEANGTDTLSVLHFTNPEKKDEMLNRAKSLSEYDQDGDGVKEGVSYDVFATSYYPSIHGTMDNLKSVLSEIAGSYDKYVMVAETSWGTSLLDGDGDGNGFKLNPDMEYGASVQWQAYEVRDVMNAVNEIDVTLENGDKAALGMFYWELAWLPVQYAYAETDNNDTWLEDVHEVNQQMWEKHGSGWASSYASVYDPEDAGRYYGGNPNDNQIAFDFWGNPLESLNVFKYVEYGAVASENGVLKLDSETIECQVGSEFTTATLPAAVRVTFADRTSSDVAVNWNAEDVALITSKITSTEGIGTYTVNGTIVVNEKNEAVSCTVKIVPKNIVLNSSFEEKEANWTITGLGTITNINNDGVREGALGLHFWDGSDFTFTAEQTVTADKAGLYNAEMWVQGSYLTGSLEGEKIVLQVETAAKTYESAAVVLDGFDVWVQGTIEDIELAAGESATIRILASNLKAGAWGTFDDVCLYWNKEAENKVPENSEVPEGSETPEDSEVPEHSEAPEDSEVPETSETLEASETPENSEVPEASEIPENSEVPEASETPENSETSEDNKTPEAPTTGDTTPILPFVFLMMAGAAVVILPLRKKIQ